MTIDKKIDGDRAEGVLKSSTWMMVGFASQLALQLLQFVVLTRHFGPENFGRLAATLAMINLISPLAGMGFSDLLLVKVSQNRDLARYWFASATIATLLLGLGCTAVLVLSSAWLTSNQWLAWQWVLGLAVSELVLVRCGLIAGRMFQAHGKAGRMMGITVSVAAVKALAAIVVLVGGLTKFSSWIGLHTLLVLLVSVAAMFSAHRTYGWSAARWDWLWKNSGAASGFMFGTVGKACYTDLDKLMLARWSTSLELGLYAVGYKVIALSFLPIRSILEGTAVKQFQLADQSAKQCADFTRRILIYNLAISIAVALVLYGAAPAIVMFAGVQYAASAPVIMLGCVLPIIQTFHYTFGNFLTATGAQASRTIMQFVVVGAYIALGVVLIGQLGWAGAIVTSLISEGLLAILLAVCCYAKVRDAGSETLVAGEPSTVLAGKASAA